MKAKQRLLEYYKRSLTSIGRQGEMKITHFSLVYHNLMPVQQNKLRELCGGSFQELLEGGSAISLALAYNENEILVINQRTQENRLDKDLWNKYADAYDRMNHQLNDLAIKIANQVYGLPIQATLAGMASTVEHVRDYFPHTVSHRLIAELAGMGWRGINGLIIHPLYSCGMRFASIITPLTFKPDQKVDGSCEDCNSCLEVCPFLRKKEKLEDYRENCRKFINKLNLEGEVCGKCIKACYVSSKFRDQFHLTKKPSGFGK
ncbi:MAG: hypothetical protein ACXAEU_05990 [Candidatus Hodarchaeales archaeon]